ncbi:hypothetical protein BGX38DRAFT_198269 [Terfezia claveryi]|nr:hypothetical protein BGX38DRAFT_198269 [Terfezia claveryi]
MAPLRISWATLNKIETTIAQLTLILSSFPHQCVAFRPFPPPSSAAIGLVVRGNHIRPPYAQRKCAQGCATLAGVIRGGWWLYHAYQSLITRPTLCIVATTCSNNRRQKPRHTTCFRLSNS